MIGASVAANPLVIALFSRFRHGIAEDVDIGLVTKDAIPLVASGFAEDANLGEAGDEVVGGGVGGVRKFLNFGHREDRTLVEVFENAVAIARSSPEVSRDRAAVVFP